MEFFYQTLLFRYKCRFIFFTRQCYLGTNVNLFSLLFFRYDRRFLNTIVPNEHRLPLLKRFIKLSPIDFSRKTIIFTYEFIMYKLSMTFLKHRCIVAFSKKNLFKCFAIVLISITEKRDVSVVTETKPGIAGRTCVPLSTV